MFQLKNLVHIFDDERYVWDWTFSGAPAGRKIDNARFPRAALAGSLALGWRAKRFQR